jgi:hypothetical protein
LNNLFDNNIYPGNKLLVKQDVVLPIASLPALPAREPLLASTSVPVSQTPTLLPTVTIILAESASPAPESNNSIMGITIGILALALLGGGFFAWLGMKKKTDH